MRHSLLASNLHTMGGVLCQLHRSRTRRIPTLKQEHAPPSAPFVLSIKNTSALSISIFVDGLGPFATCAGKTITKTELPRGQLDGARTWEAVHALHGVHHLTVASGRVPSGRNAQSGGVALHVGILPDGLRACLPVGMNLNALSVLVKAQKARHRLLEARKRAELLRREKAVRGIQRALRAYLKQSPRQCFICFDSVPWASMVTLAEHKCHRTCHHCAVQHVNTAISEGRLYVRCPGLACTNLISDSRVEQLASADALEHQANNRRAANARRLESLSECDAEFIAFCSEMCRKCPNCSVVIYRFAGCDHMLCRCGTRFDWEKTDGVKISAPKSNDGTDTANGIST